jgi:predicted esterase
VSRWNRSPKALSQNWPSHRCQWVEAMGRRDRGSKRRATIWHVRLRVTGANLCRMAQDTSRCTGTARRVYAVALLVGLMDCRQPARARDEVELPVGTTTATASPAEGKPEAGAPKLAPLTDAVWLESLPMPPGHAAFVSVPLGATEPRPVMVGMHGAGDRPEWACGGYRAATDAFPFIVCPRGVPEGPSDPDKFASPGPKWIQEDVASALRALRARFGPHVADGPLLYAGFSLGAIHGVKVIAENASLFPTALLIEGGYSEFTPVLASAYAKGGGKRIMLGCGKPACRPSFAATQRALERAGVEVLLLDTKTGRHNLDGPMMKALHDAWPRLVAGDARWFGLEARR